MRLSLSWRRRQITRNLLRAGDGDDMKIRWGQLAFSPVGSSSSITAFIRAADMTKSRHHRRTISGHIEQVGNSRRAAAVMRQDEQPRTRGKIADHLLMGAGVDGQADAIMQRPAHAACRQLKP